jgi:hypothetical protein
MDSPALVGKEGVIRTHWRRAQACNPDRPDALVAWLPAQEFALACERWPVLLREYGEDYAAYCLNLRGGWPPESPRACSRSSRRWRFATTKRGASTKASTQPIPPTPWSTSSTLRSSSPSHGLPLPSTHVGVEHTAVPRLLLGPGRLRVPARFSGSLVRLW